MAVSLAIRPRAQTERRALAEALLSSPSSVGIAHDDDGWASAALAIAGRRVYWSTSASPRRASALLSSLSLPPLEFGRVPVTLDRSLQPSRLALAGMGSLPMQKGPLVSVLVTTYNQLPLLQQCIESVRAQSWPVEIIVVDDGSSDGTHQWLGAQSDLQVLSHDRHQGKSQALNTGLAHLQGAYTLILGERDLLPPGAVQVLATTMEACPSLVGLFGDSVLFDAAEVQSYRPALRLPPRVMRRATLAQIPGYMGAFLVRSRVWKEVGPYDHRLGRGQDMDMFQRLTQHGDVEAIPLPTLYSRARQAHDSATHASQTRAVFLERWRSNREHASRAEGFSWALGLFQRSLTQEAHMELVRWPGPDTPTEVWARQHIGASTKEQPTSGTLVVVDDGDPGALESCLDRHSKRTLALWVNLEVPRDPVGEVRLHWDGTYGAQERLDQWVSGEGPVHLRLSSSPEWSPPPIDDLSMLPPLPAHDALLILAAAMNWPMPSMLRSGTGPMSQLSWQAWRARRKLLKQEPRKALAALGPILEALPNWAPAWSMAAEAFEGLGMQEDARRCRSRELLHQVA